jgi:hypothetical protein
MFVATKLVSSVPSMLRRIRASVTVKL